MSAEECIEEFSALYGVAQPGDSLHTKLLTTTRPNLLFVIWEGFGGEFVEALGGIPEVAPQFNKLVKEGVFFSNHYATSFRTDRGTVSIVSGHLSYPNTSIMKLPVQQNRLSSLARSLRDTGYRTDFLYGGDINFTNTQGYLRNMGYAEVVGDKSFSEVERKTNAWGVNDDIMFDYLYEDLVKRDASTPWHSAFLTLSSHEPFEVPYSRLSDPKLNAFAYTDSCFGTFVEKLKKTDIWDNLLLVVLPDHGFRYRVTGDEDRKSVVRERVYVLV